MDAPTFPNRMPLDGIRVLDLGQIYNGPYAGWLLARLACQLGDRSDAEDLVQESLLAAFDQLAELKDPVRFAGWLAGIADNKLRMWHRRRVVQLNLLEAEPACEGPGPVGESPPVRSLVREPWRG